MELELTEYEEKMVLEHRKQMERNKNQSRYMQHLLNTASAFNNWLVDQKRGPSFTTFMDEFGYDEQRGFPRPGIVYEDIAAIVDAADNAAHSAMSGGSDIEYRNFVYREGKEVKHQ